MAVAIGIIAVVGIMTDTLITDSMVTKGSVVEFAEVMNSTAGTASMVEARSAAVVAASMVEGDQVMEADTGKT
jgi:ADP-glucose pyrophosphorylase